MSIELEGLELEVDVSTSRLLLCFCCRIFSFCFGFPLFFKFGFCGIFDRRVVVFDVKFVSFFLDCLKKPRM